MKHSSHQATVARRWVVATGEMLDVFDYQPFRGWRNTDAAPSCKAVFRIAGQLPPADSR
jgi:hypothetical protein